MDLENIGGPGGPVLESKNIGGPRPPRPPSSTGPDDNINISSTRTVKMSLDETEKLKKSKLMNFFFLFLVCQLTPVNYIK